jgi:F-type H+-transporting ATPase subunit gamma
MPGLKEVRNRIASVNTTKQVTSAMKMVSAAKLRKAQGAILKLRPYANKLNELIGNLSQSADLEFEIPYLKARPVKKVLLVVITSNRGLCGAFNSNVFKATNHYIAVNYQPFIANKQLDVITIGKKATEYFTKRKFNVIKNFDHLFDTLTYEKTTQIAEELMKYYESGAYDKIELVYNQFKNAVTQVLKVEPYLPVVKTDLGSDKKTSQTDYIYEPDKDTIITELVPKSLKIQVYKAVLDSWASEHGARMSAMQKATDNAEDLLKSLRLSYNKARQASITREIIEIVSGVNALKG